MRELNEMAERRAHRVIGVIGRVQMMMDEAVEEFSSITNAPEQMAMIRAHHNATKDLWLSLIKTIPWESIGVVVVEEKEHSSAAQVFTATTPWDFKFR